MDASAQGSPGRPLRIAIVGAGPSGFYALQALSRAEGWHLAVDLYDRLPTPFGLVRGGVAPDHASIKAVARSYDRLARAPNVRFFGGVRLGQHLSVPDLEAHYDAVVWAIGCESEKRLGIPGEDLPGVHSATEFVFWYNGHPDYRDRRFALAEATRVAVVGNGNVSMDVARVLGRAPQELATTDIAAHALDVLRDSAVTEILLLGRRGPAQAAFTSPEIRELGHLASVDLCVRPESLALDPASARQAEADPAIRKNLEILRESAERRIGSAPRRVLARFCVSPVAFCGDGRLEAIRLVHNQLVERDGAIVAEPVGEPFEEPVQLAFKAVGYRGVPLPGLPFDDRRGHVPNVGGRVTGAPGHYVVGWAKRGPSGLVGTNKPDAEETVVHLLEDRVAAGAAPPDRPDAADTLRARGHRWVDWQGWSRIDAEELARGQRAGKAREKVTDVEEMFSIAT